MLTYTIRYQRIEGYGLPTRWSKEEDEKLIENYRSFRYQDLCKLFPNRSESSIRNRIFRLQKSGDIPETKWWTSEEVEFLCSNWESLSAVDIAKTLGRTEWSVKRKIHKLQKSGETKAKKKTYKYEWSDSDDKFLLENYTNNTLQELSLLMNRSVDVISKRLRAIGITSKPRPKRDYSDQIHKVCSICNEDFFVIRSQSSAKYCSIQCKYKGTTKSKPNKEELSQLYFDERLTSCEISKIFDVSDGTVNKWLESYGINRRSNKETQNLRHIQIKRMKTRVDNGNLVPNGGGYKHVQSGKRADLDNIFFRSAWEANVARLFNYLGYDWEFEPKPFYFTEAKRGSVVYVPDFYVTKPDGEEFWLEVKGRMNTGDYTKMLNFKREYKEDFERMFGIVHKSSKTRKSFERLKIPIYAYYDDLTKKYKDVIPYWEGR